ncbi:hypothetical protein AGMMS50249_6240 [candidate division SR1 bacterium]|nr:hypothetical protein AGMMS50249_6240 [candidate division SR1 bacterium]
MTIQCLGKIAKFDCSELIRKLNRSESKKLLNKYLQEITVSDKMIAVINKNKLKMTSSQLILFFVAKSLSQAMEKKTREWNSLESEIEKETEPEQKIEKNRLRQIKLESRRQIIEDFELIKTRFWKESNDEWRQHQFITVFESGKVDDDQYADVYDSYLFSKG